MGGDDGAFEARQFNNAARLWRAGTQRRSSRRGLLARGRSGCKALRRCRGRRRCRRWRQRSAGPGDPRRRHSRAPRGAAAFLPSGAAQRHSVRRCVQSPRWWARSAHTRASGCVARRGATRRASQPRCCLQRSGTRATSACGCSARCGAQRSCGCIHIIDCTSAAVGHPMSPGLPLACTSCCANDFT